MSPTKSPGYSLVSFLKITGIALALLVSTSPARAQRRGPQAPDPYTVSNYTKAEFRIPMRDGAKLFTVVYMPKDASEKYPIIMQRTPYAVNGVTNYPRSLGPSPLFIKEKFIFVYQDVRGRNLSEGDFIDVPVHKSKFSGPKDFDESTDSYDTIDWLVKNVPNNNGRVGTFGTSYPGFFSAYTLINAHPALKAASPQAPMADVGNGDDAYHNGAFFLAANFGFYRTFYPRPKLGEPAKQHDRIQLSNDQYDFYLKMGSLAEGDAKYYKGENFYYTDLLKHPNYDEFWSSRALSPHMHNLTAQVLVVGGWFDAEDLGGTPKLFQAISQDAGAPAHTLVMGPWRHGGWNGGNGNTLGNLSFETNTAAFFRENIEFPFFVNALKDKGDGLKTKEDPQIPKAWVFQTGEDKWRRFDSWPPTNATHSSIYLQAGGKLSFTPGGDAAYDEYVSDPANPVPVIGVPGDGMAADYMTYNQKFASERKDVLTYTSEPLDKPVTIAGPVVPMLHVSTSGTDSDFDVKLIDVLPDNTPDITVRDNTGNDVAVHMGGYQMLVRGEPFRGKFRNSMVNPEPFKPGEQSRVGFAMPDVMHTFLPGHRIMVQIQSSWFPLTDRNPQIFTDIPNAKDSDFQKATERVYRGGPQGSRIDVLQMQQ